MSKNIDLALSDKVFAETVPFVAPRQRGGGKSADLYSRLYQYFISNCKLRSGNLLFVLHERYQPGFERETS